MVKYVNFLVIIFPMLDPSIATSFLAWLVSLVIKLVRVANGSGNDQLIVVLPTPILRRSLKSGSQRRTCLHHLFQKLVNLLTTA